MLRIAILGCGAIADSHAWAIQQIAGCEMVAACDSEILMAKLFCERFRVPQAFTNLGQMLSEARPDVVHILTPPQSHYALARQCLEAGCHVYVEKPFTLYLAEAESLLKLAQAKNLKVTVGHDAQFSQATLELRQLVSEGYLGGAAVHMESYYGYEFGSLYGNALLGDKRHWVRSLPGKLLQNVISHGIARIAEFLPGNDARVIAHGFVSSALRSMGEDEIVDELRVIITDETGATAYFTFSAHARPTLNQFLIYGHENGLCLDETQQSVIKLRGERFKSYAEKFIPHAIFAQQYIRTLVRNIRLFLARDFHTESGKKYLTGAFYRSIVENTPVPIPYREILLTSRIMDAIFQQIPSKDASAQAVPSRLLRPIEEPGRSSASFAPVPQNGVQAAAFQHPEPVFEPAPAARENSASAGFSFIPSPSSPREAAPVGNSALKQRNFIIINADDWGRSAQETEAALSCFQMGRITSVSAMVFMADSERAAALAKNYDLDIGLHLNLCEPFTAPDVPPEISRLHRRISRFLNLNKYSLVLYHPFLRKAFRAVYRAQLEEYLRLYGKPPSHIDGHLHKHLCTNMLLDEVIPRGQKVRRGFSFAPGEKGILNQAYRSVVNRWLAQRYILTDYFFSLHYSLHQHLLDRVAQLARFTTVELMVHPKNPWETEYLKSDKFTQDFQGIPRATYALLDAPAPGAESSPAQKAYVSDYHGV